MTAPPGKPMMPQTFVPPALSSVAAQQAEAVGPSPNTKVVTGAVSATALIPLFGWGVSAIFLGFGIPLPPGVAEGAGALIGGLASTVIAYFTPNSRNDLLQHAPATLDALKETRAAP